MTQKSKGSKSKSKNSSWLKIVNNFSISRPRAFSRYLIVWVISLLIIGWVGFFGFGNILEEGGEPTYTKDQVLPTISHSYPDTNFNKTINEYLADPIRKKPSIKVPVLSTTNWKDVTFSGVAFKIPETATFRTDPDSSSFGIVDYDNWPDEWINVKEISQEEYFANEKIYDCRYIFQEAEYRKVTGLQIASDPSWCQGGKSGFTVIEVGKKLVTVYDSAYDNETKVIYRDSLRDTLISTLKPVD